MKLQISPDELRALAKRHELRRLKDRDFEVLSLSLRGVSVNRIAAELGIAVSTAAHTLHKREVRQLIRLAELQPYQALATSADSVVQALAHQALFDPGMFANVKCPADLDTMVSERDRRLLVKGWKYDQKGNFIIEFVDKEKALDRLAQYHGVYRATAASMEDYTAALERALERHERRHGRLIDHAPRLDIADE